MNKQLNPKVKLSKKLKPLGGSVMVSVITETQDLPSGIIIPDAAKEEMIANIQKVMAVGPSVTQVEVGDEVCIKMGEITVPKQVEVRKTASENDTQMQTKWVLDENKFFTVDGVEYMLILEHNIAYKLLKEEKDAK